MWKVGCYRTFTILIISLLTTGCGPASEKENTLEGCQERNKVLSDQVEDLKKQVAELKAETPAIRDRMEAELKKVREDLANQHSNELASIHQLHEEKVKKLEGDNADLQIQLGSVTKQKLALQELADAGQLLPGAERTRFSIERTIWGALLLVSLGLLMFVTGKYHKLRGQLNVTVVQRASQLREIEVNP